jgi:hypothetical protein
MYYIDKNGNKSDIGLYDMEADDAYDEYISKLLSQKRI